MAQNSRTENEELIQAIVQMSNGKIRASEIFVSYDFQFNQIRVSSSGVYQILPADDLHRIDPRTRQKLCYFMLKDFVRAAMHPVAVKTRLMARPPEPQYYYGGPIDTWSSPLASTSSNQVGRTGWSNPRTVWDPRAKPVDISVK
jgi:hypothetical protein